MQGKRAMNFELRDETSGKKLQIKVFQQRSTVEYSKLVEFVLVVYVFVMELITFFPLTRQIIHFISKSELYLSTFGFWFWVFFFLYYKIKR